MAPEDTTTLRWDKHPPLSSQMDKVDKTASKVSTVSKTEGFAAGNRPEES